MSAYTWTRRLRKRANASSRAARSAPRTSAPRRGGKEWGGGDTEEAWKGIAGKQRRRERGVTRQTWVIAGGEANVRACGGGRGGRNQEFALVAARSVHGLGGVEMLSAGSDGVDGPTDAAGAFVNAQTVAGARAKGLDVEAALARHDSYETLRRLGALFCPGPTGTNVMDLKMALIVPRIRA